MASGFNSLCRLAPAVQATPSKPIKHRSPVLSSVKKPRSEVLQSLMDTVQSMKQDSKSEATTGEDHTEPTSSTVAEDTSEVLDSCVQVEEVDSAPTDSGLPIGESTTDLSQPVVESSLSAPDITSLDTATKDHTEISDQSQAETSPPSEDLDTTLTPFLPPKPKESTSLPLPPLPSKSPIVDYSPPPVPPHAPRSTTPSRFSQKKDGDDWELAVLVDKILSTSDVIAEVVTVIRLERGGLEPSVGAHEAEKTGNSFDTYSKVLGPLQFGEYKFSLIVSLYTVTI